MKKSLFLLSALFLSVFAVNADSYHNGGVKSFIFIENGVEFAVFPDGQFDFNVPENGPNINVGVRTSVVSVTFNSGYDYSQYIQYDDFGAIVQIQNTPVYYDLYGRILRAGNISIIYNEFGLVENVGGLHVYYDRFNRFSRCIGYVNVRNRYYGRGIWHTYYRAPAIDYCVVYNRPYRQFYTPTRYVYNNRPYRNNVRRRTAVASRRGNTIVRNSSYASVRGNRTVRQSSANTNTSTRGNITRSNRIRPVAQANAPRTRTNTTTTPRTRTNTTPTRNRANASSASTTRPNRTLSRPQSSSVRPQASSSRVRQSSNASSRTRTTARTPKRDKTQTRSARPSNSRSNSTSTRSRSSRRI